MSLSASDRERDLEGKCFSLWRQQRFTPLTHLAWIGPEPRCSPSNACLIALEGKLMTGALAQLERTITGLPSVAQVSSCWMRRRRLKVSVSAQPPGQETVCLYQVRRDKMRPLFFV